ncbi:hypothetical protein EI74_0224 [Mycoplasma testudineum]|uniref:Lipoprotein n=1 Tax=Mycoplasma testudineum TaxID=244584 RepID=A0A4R6IFR4_9MOLU|nr:hypothetical protein [Mycoplasma testudineum]OYD27052.1 hypothetical protein CG473_00155 [Mycoplasma testudineum]TDO21193.1 hypothetical protein EI74_0224 [Mycoplasma testudineum]
MKKFKFFMSISSILTLSVFASCSQMISVKEPNDDDGKKFEINHILNAKIAAKIENDFKKIKNINPISNENELRVRINNSYIFQNEKGQIEIKRKYFPSGEKGIYEYYYGFIDTIKERKWLDFRKEVDINRLFENGLINKDQLTRPSMELILHALWQRKLYNFHKIITNFSDFKKYLAYTGELLYDDILSEKGNEKIKKFKSEKLDNLIDFNGINEEFFKENLLIVSALSDNERIIKIDYDKIVNKINLKTLNMSESENGIIDFIKTVNDFQIRDIRYWKIIHVDLSLKFGWSLQNETLTVINKKQYGIEKENVKLDSYRIEMHDELVEIYEK